jgi:hypothetical protein
VSDADINRIDRWAKAIQNAGRESKQFSTTLTGKAMVGLEAIGAGFLVKGGNVKAATEIGNQIFKDFTPDIGKLVSDGIMKSPLFSQRRPQFGAVEGDLMDHPQLPESPVRSGRGGQSSVDALQRIGGFTGAAAKNTGVSIEKEQLNELKHINRNTQQRPNSSAIF